MTSVRKHWLATGAKYPNSLITWSITPLDSGDQCCLSASKIILWVISCLRKEKSLNFDQIHFEREGKPQNHMITPWGGGCWVKLSKIVILCYYVSIFYLIIIKIFRIFKIVRHCQHPPTGGGVWCDIPAVKFRTTTHQMAWLDIDGMIGNRWTNTEVPALGDSLSWDTNQRVCDITTLRKEDGWITRASCWAKLCKLLQIKLRFRQFILWFVSVLFQEHRCVRQMCDFVSMCPTSMRFRLHVSNK